MFQKCLSLILLSIFSFQPLLASEVERLDDLLGREPSSFSSITELLEGLPPSYSAKFVLMFKSRSLQEASIDNPRVILYGEDAKLLLAFNGLENQKGYDSLEIIQFNDESKQFEFFNIKEFSGNLEVSEKNPQKCMGCHRQSLRPNWDPYPFWRGAYGSLDHRDLPLEEYRNLKNFIRKVSHLKRANKRYAILANIEEVYQFESNDLRVLAENPNANLSDLLTVLNMSKLYNIVKQHPDFQAFKFAYGGASDYNILEFFPAFLLELYSERFSLILEELKEIKSKLHPNHQEFYNVWRLARQRLLFEIQGIPLAEASMMFERGTYHFVSGYWGLGELSYQMNEDDPELRALKVHDYPPMISHEKAKALSLKRLGEMFPALD